MRHQRSKRLGFTALESVVSAASVGVLSVCLVGASAGARTGSKQSKCLSNLSRVGRANIIYASLDPGDAAVPVHAKFFQQDPFDQIYVGAYEWGGKSGKGETAFATGTPGDPVNSRYGTRAGFGPATRPLNRILYGDVFPDYANDPGTDNANWLADAELDLDYQQCPSDTGYTGIHKRAFRDEQLTSYDHYGTSYAANLFMVGSAGGGEMVSNSPFLHRLSEIIAPATTLAYQENNGRFAWASRELNSCGFIGQGIPGTVHGWHAKDWTFTTAFIDGHADLIYMRGYQNYDIGHYPPARDLGQSELAASYRCLIVRGEAWRKDTLPRPFAYTGLFWGGNGRASYEDGLE